ncbi:MAG: hypothetical protein J5741_05500 [Bacteroidales bacterium]|nr:hypothetical protein [Bacteroidales bacterium]
MKTKKYNTEEEPLPKAKEPTPTYAPSSSHGDGVPVINTTTETIEEKPAEFDACYARLKAEADDKFGKKERMSVDEYFGKLWHIVNGLYEKI